MIEQPVGRSASGKRQFTIGFKLEFLQLWDQAIERGAKTRLLREYGLAGSVVREWKYARDRGDFEAGMVHAARKSPQMSKESENRAELARLRAENKQLRQKVQQAEAAQDILGKAFGLLEGITKQPEPDPQIPPALMSAKQYEQWLTRNALTNPHGTDDEPS